MTETENMTETEQDDRTKMAVLAWLERPKKGKDGSLDILTILAERFRIEAPTREIAAAEEAAREYIRQHSMNELRPGMKSFIESLHKEFNEDLSENQTEYEKTTIGTVNVTEHRLSRRPVSGRVTELPQGSLDAKWLSRRMMSLVNRNDKTAQGMAAYVVVPGEQSGLRDKEGDPVDYILCLSALGYAVGHEPTPTTVSGFRQVVEYTGSATTKMLALLVPGRTFRALSTELPIWVVEEIFGQKIRWRDLNDKGTGSEMYR